MIKLKTKKIKTKQITQNDTDNYSLLLNNGLATIESTANIVGMELDVLGKFSFSKFLNDDWIALAGVKKIVIADTKMVGIKTGDLFSFTGKLKIKQATMVDANQEIITFGSWTDEYLYRWDITEGNQFDVNTTTWDSMKSQNINTTIVVTKKEDEEGGSLDDDQGAGAFAGPGYIKR